MYKRMNKALAVMLSLALVFSSMAFLLTGCAGQTDTSTEANTQSESSEKTTAGEVQDTTEETTAKAENEVVTIKIPEVANRGKIEKRVNYFDVHVDLPEYTVNAPEYIVEPGLANVDFGRLSSTKEPEYREHMSKDHMALLEENHYFIKKNGSSEFCKSYEMNQYMQIPNFITTDTILHTYHKFFEKLLIDIEEGYLREMSVTLTNKMLEYSILQYEALKGTEFENAAVKNAAYFMVGARLIESEEAINEVISSDEALQASDVYEKIDGYVESELKKIYAADGIDVSELMTMNYLDGMDPYLEDFSQYKPRSHYTRNDNLKSYFRLMMWYGRMNFVKALDDDMRSMILMTIAKNTEPVNELWDKLYSVTEFFVGESDDVSMDQSTEVLMNAYGGALPNVYNLVDNEKNQKAIDALKQTEGPKINSIVVFCFDDETTYEEKTDGIRFMGQRYTLDADIMNQLVFRQVQENSEGALRMLPSALDVAAGMGSDYATELLENEGAFDYENYPENMKKIKEGVASLDSATWVKNLYFGWLSSLRSLCEKNGEGYPLFMQQPAWQKKKLNTFLGSYTELKHDTVLYAKQMMAEMGGGFDEEFDDRGYVEAEPELYAGVEALTKSTKSGLESMGILDEKTAEGLDIFAEICGQLKTISVKELEGTLPTDEEFDFIRRYGGMMEHLYFDYIQTRDEDGQIEQNQSSIITDIATDPNGSVLYIANGGFDTIYVIVCVDGVVKLSEGAVYSNYEFEVNSLDRLTDEDWREMKQNLYDGDPSNDVEIPPHYWLEDVMAEYHYN